MAKYTTTLFELASTMVSGTVADRSLALQQWLFNDNFGLTPALRSQFEPAFIRHYLFSEIGYETPEMFRNRVHVLLYGKADYYNELWKLNEILTSWDLMEDDIDLRKDDTEHANTQDTEDTSHSRDTGEREAYGETEEERNESAQSMSQDSETTGNNTRSGEAERTEENKNTGTITDSGNQSMVEQEQGNAANSNFPQANIASNRDYYTDGSINNSARSSSGETENRRTLADGYNRSGNEQTSGTEKLSSILLGRTAQGLQAERSRESMRDRSRELQEMLKQMVSKAMQEDRQLNSISRGRNQRRQVPELVQMISQGYIHVPMVMIKDQAQNFMGVW